MDNMEDKLLIRKISNVIGNIVGNHQKCPLEIVNRRTGRIYVDTYISDFFPVYAITSGVPLETELLVAFEIRTFDIPNYNIVERDYLQAVIYDDLMHRPEDLKELVVILGDLPYMFRIEGVGYPPVEYIQSMFKPHDRSIPNPYSRFFLKLNIRAKPIEDDLPEDIIPTGVRHIFTFQENKE